MSFYVDVLCNMFADNYTVVQLHSVVHCDQAQSVLLIFVLLPTWTLRPEGRGPLTQIRCAVTRSPTLCLVYIVEVVTFEFANVLPRPSALEFDNKLHIFFV